MLQTIILCGFAINVSANDICSKYKAESRDNQEYRVVFGDSGVGGLIFALDVAQELEPKLKNLETEYKVNFVFHHFGDSKNAPYGNKNPREIKKYTTQFLEYLLGLPNTHSAAIACNTASAIYNAKMSEYFNKKYRDIKIITMIDDSSQQLLKSAIGDDKEQNLYVAFISNPATVKSGVYQNKINEIAKQKNKNLKLYSYAPQNWVRNIENGVAQEIAQAEVNKDLEAFKIAIGQNFNKITTLGVFCTHYPFYKNQMQEFFNKNAGHKVEILTQGKIFADKIYESIVQNLQEGKFNYQKRVEKMPYKCVKNIVINSELSGNNIEQTRDVILHTHPQYLNQISFKKITIN